jgi:hypothetical protein
MHQHGGQREDEDGGGMGGMGHGEGLKGALLMVLCCLPMIAIAALLIFGVFR